MDSSITCIKGASRVYWRQASSDTSFSPRCQIYCLFQAETIITLSPFYLPFGFENQVNEMPQNCLVTS